MKKTIFTLIIAILVVVAFLIVPITVSADELSDNINNQLENLDLEELRGFIDEQMPSDAGDDFMTSVQKMLKGEFDVDAESFFEYVLNLFFSQAGKALPSIIGVVIIAIFCGIFNSLKAGFLGDDTSNVVLFVAYLAVALILATHFSMVFIETKNIIEKLTKLVEIMSPIILTLMVASGGVVSASVFKPVVVLLSTGISNIFLYVILPLSVFTCVLSVLAHFSDTIRVGKFVDFGTSLIKWILGLIIVIFGFFLTAQGITASAHDGISIKAAKYALSNGVPLIGGFLGGGFDLIVAGSILIKNSIGIVGIFAFFYVVLSPIAYMVALNLSIKLCGAISETSSGGKISNICASFSKGITYCVTCILVVSIMFFVTVLLMIFCANSYFI